MEPFNTTIEITEAKAVGKFREYDANPWKYETDQSREIAKRVRELAKSLKLNE